MDDSWHYIDLICPICGGGKVRCYSDYNLCEDCRYIVPDFYDTQEVVLYNIDNFVTNTGVACRSVNSEDLMSKTLLIDCELIKFHHKELDIEFEFDTKKLKNIDTIEINGHRFVKEKAK